MGLQIEYTAVIEGDCETLLLTNVTENYSTVDTSGYGSPNPARGDILTAKADITFPDGTTATNLTLNLPAAIDTPTELTSDDLGFSAGDKLPSGVWQITVTEHTTTKDYTTTLHIMNICTEQCCLDKLIAEIDVEDCCCDCSSSEINQAALVDWLLTGAVYAVQCQKFNRGKELLEAAGLVCNFTKCGCSD